MAQSPIVQAIKQICDEKNIPYETVIATIEAALASAYRKDFGTKLQNLQVSFNPEDGSIRVFDLKTVVTDEFVSDAIREEEERKAAREEALARGEPPPPPPTEVVQTTETGEVKEEIRYNPKFHLSLTEARALKPDAVVDEELRLELEVPGAFGRMAAQTAKQVITQRLREAERSVIFEEWKKHEGEVVSGVVARREGRVVLVEVGNRVNGIILPDDQLPSEPYRSGDRLKVYLSGVNMTTKGPEILLSRTHPEIVRKLFSQEIPEVAGGTVTVRGVAREAGSRSKVAVSSSAQNVDPIGSCIGQRGSRIQTIIQELGGEKIDIVEWHEDAATFIGRALSPAKVKSVEVDEAAHTAQAHVVTDQLSLAIGRGGQNVRLAARLTTWKISVVESKPEGEGAVVEAAPDDEPKPEEQPA